MKNVLTGILLSIISGYNLFSQTLSQQEESLLSLYNRVIKEYADTSKLKGNDSIQTKLLSILKEQGSFQYSFTRLNKIGFVYSPDSAFRMINWNFILSDGSARYYLIIQIRPDQKGQCKVFHFEQNTNLVTGTSEWRKFNEQSWYGALYYSILPQRLNGRKYYILLGFLYHNLLTNQKVIEPFYFDESGSPILGMPVVSIAGKSYSRLIFEYNEQVSMTLRYDEKKNLIIFDHLAPNDPINSSIYEFYGPDGTYDGLRYDGALWHLEAKVTATNPKQSESQHKIIKGK